MANELNLTGTITYTDSEGRVQSITVPKCIADASRFTVLRQNIGTSEEPLILGDITAPTALFLINLDGTNFVNVKTGTGGVIFSKMAKDPNGDGNGGFCLLSCLGSGAQAPYLIADTAACDVLAVVCH